MNLVVPEMLRAAFRPRPTDANKRTVGVVGVVGGSDRYPHAPVIAALGARAAGAGLVHLAVPDASRAAAAALVPEASFVPRDAVGEPPAEDVAVVGMGLGAEASARRLASRWLTADRYRLVVDADALNCLATADAAERDRFRSGRGSRILTPHEGEAARLLGVTRGEVASDRLAAARELAARFGATVVLKGPGTLVVPADGSRVYRNETGNPFMALGGMGDLLAGVVGARWAYLRTADPFLVAAGSVWLHGLAADRVVNGGGDPSLVGVAAEIGRLRVFLDNITSFQQESCL